MSRLGILTLIVVRVAEPTPTEIVRPLEFQNPDEKTVKLPLVR